MVPLAAAFLGMISCHQESASPDDPAAKDLLQRYFSTWSARDMEGYGRCFDDSARIYYLEKDGKVTAQGKTDFVHEQSVLHQEAASPMHEVPGEIKLQGDDKVKQAAVTWVLTIGTKQITGTDFFTIAHEGSEWKILSLAFYGE
jgi:hypothetical protein